MRVHWKGRMQSELLEGLEPWCRSEGTAGYFALCFSVTMGVENRAVRGLSVLGPLLKCAQSAFSGGIVYVGLVCRVEPGTDPYNEERLVV